MKRRLSFAVYALFLSTTAGAFEVPDGSQIRWRCSGGASTVIAVTVLNKKAGNPFASGFDPSTYTARYGDLWKSPHPACNGGNPTFLLFAEDKDSYLAGWMREACLAGDPSFQDQKQWECWPCPEAREGKPCTATEDYAAVVGVRPGGRPGGQKTPGVPAITSLTTPGPGLVQVAWRTRAGHDHFLVSVGGVGFRQIPGSGATQYATVVELPPGVGGEMEVSVRASMGGPLGQPSLPKRVKVEPRPTEPAPLPPPPTPEPVPEPKPEPTPAPASKCWLVRVTGADARLEEVLCPK